MKNANVKEKEIMARHVSLGCSAALKKTRENPQKIISSAYSDIN